MYRQSARDLGALESEHGYPKGRAGALLMAGGLSVVLGLVLFAWMTDWMSPHNRLSFSSDEEQWVVSLVVSGLLVLVGLGALFARWRFVSTRAQVYEGGLVYASFGRSRTLLWEEIERVWSWDSIQGTRAVAHCKLEDKRGQLVKVSPRLEEVRLLRPRALEALLRHRLPEARKAHAAGETLRFGKVLLEREGLKVGWTRLAWDDIKAVRGDSRSFLVWKRRGGTKRVDRLHVPNLEILMELLKGRVAFEP